MLDELDLSLALEFQEFARIGRCRSDGVGERHKLADADLLHRFKYPGSRRATAGLVRSAELRTAILTGRMMTLVRRQTMALSSDGDGKARSPDAMQRFAVTIPNGIGAVRSAIDKQMTESID